MVPQFASYNNGTIVRNISVPVFDIQSFQWINNTADLPQGIRNSIIITGCSGHDCGYLNISEPGNLLGQIIPGTSALLKDTPWTYPDPHFLPEPTTFSGTKYAAIFVARYPNLGKSGVNNCNNTSTRFNPLPAGVAMINFVWSNPNATDCFAVAKIQIRAGVTNCSGSPSGNVRTLLGTNQSTSSCSLSAASASVVELSLGKSVHFSVQADPLVEQVFALMPVVQQMRTAISAVNLYPPNYSLGISNNISANL